MQKFYTADQLFATLDPTTRRLVIPHALSSETQEILMTDTVGFIHELPASLMDAVFVPLSKKLQKLMPYSIW